MGWLNKSKKSADERLADNILLVGPDIAAVCTIKKQPGKVPCMQITLGLGFLDFVGVSSKLAIGIATDHSFLGPSGYWKAMVEGNASGSTQRSPFAVLHVSCHSWL
jgi:hypothetical protein